MYLFYAYCVCDDLATSKSNVFVYGQVSQFSRGVPFFLLLLREGTVLGVFGEVTASVC